MSGSDSLEQCLKGQLDVWSCQEDGGKSLRRGTVIAITRQPGCNGEAIAQALARELGLDLHDWEVVERIAKDANVSEQMVATLDTKDVSEFDDWLAGLAGGALLSSHHYMQSLRRVLFTIATHGNAVILGRGANFLLPPSRKTLGLCLVAPVEVRTKSIMQELLLSREDARKHISKLEKEQRLWIKKHGNADINDATNYHMVINTALVSPETIIKLVEEILRPGSSCTCTCR